MLRLLEGEGGQLLLARAFETPRARSSEVIRALELFVDGSAKLSAEWPPRDEEGGWSIIVYGRLENGDHRHQPCSAAGFLRAEQSARLGNFPAAVGGEQCLAFEQRLANKE